jgi:hypothetical protein
VVRHLGVGMTLAVVHLGEKRIGKRVAGPIANRPQWKTMWTVAITTDDLAESLVQTVLEPSLRTA